MIPSRLVWNEQQACRMVLSRPGDLLVRVARVDVPPGVTVEIHRGPGPKSTLLFAQTGPIPAGSKVRIVFEKVELGFMDLNLD